LANYLEAVRSEVERYGITVADIAPGYVDTPLNQKLKTRPFVIQAERAAKEIADHIERRTAKATVPSLPWRPIGFVMRNAPAPIWQRLARRRKQK